MSFIFCSIAYSQDVLSVDEMNSIYRKDHHVNKKVNKYAPLDKLMLCGQEKFGEK